MPYVCVLRDLQLSHRVPIAFDAVLVFESKCMVFMYANLMKIKPYPDIDENENRHQNQTQTQGDIATE